MVEHNLNRTPHAHTYAHTYAHTHTHTYTYIYLHTPANIYMHRDNNKTICTQYAHNPHTIRTQFAHNMHTNKHNNMQHREQNIEDTHTEHRNKQSCTEHLHNLSTEQHTCTHFIHKYSFDFIVEDYISINSIIQLYTKFIHFARLIDEVSK